MKRAMIAGVLLLACAGSPNIDLVKETQNDFPTGPMFGWSNERTFGPEPFAVWTSVHRGTHVKVKVSYREAPFAYKGLEREWRVFDDGSIRLRVSRINEWEVSDAQFQAAVEGWYAKLTGGAVVEDVVPTFPPSRKKVGVSE